MTTLEVDDLAVNYDISAGTVYSKNSCTAWVNFDGTTTPPTIRDSFNVSDVVRTTTGDFDIVHSVQMDNATQTVCGSNQLQIGGEGTMVLQSTAGNTVDKTSISVGVPGTAGGTSLTKRNMEYNLIQIFGGKN